jgi:hypothetical protein
MTAKKMRLVPDDLIDMIKRRDVQQSSPELDAVVRLDKQMEAILADKNLSLEEKVQKYNDTLGVYLTFRNQVQSMNTVQRQSHPSSVEQEKDFRGDKKTEVEVDQILQTLAKSHRQKAKQLLDILNKSGNVRWNDNNELIIDGDQIYGSNIIDLVYDTVARKKTKNPTGAPEFNKVLDKLAVPRMLRGNFASLERPKSDTTSPRKSAEGKRAKPMSDQPVDEDDYWDAS